MDNAAATLDEGLAHHRAGRLGEAVGCYQVVLAAAPAHADGLHLLGLALHQSGDSAGALVHLAAATALRPEVALFHANHGTACLAAGDATRAERCLRRAVRIDPGNADALHNLAIALLRLDRPAEAEEVLRRCVALDPRSVDVRVNLGAALLAQGRRGPAERSFRAALGVQAECVPALCGLAGALGPTAEAEELLREALRLRPGDPELMTRLGLLLRERNGLAPAEAILRLVVRARPGDADALCNLGSTLTAQGRLGEAEHVLQQALGLDHGHADTAYELGVARLLAGRLEEGWAGFERRWDRRGFAPPGTCRAPRWRGAADRKGTLLLHAEQGLGDTIQMARFIPAIAARQPVVLQVPVPLVRLVRAVAPQAEIFPDGADLPRVDFQCPLMSLPATLGIGLADLPGEVPYLAAAAGDVAAWRARLADLPGLRVGIAWAGNPGYAADHRRSVAPERLAPLAAITGISLVSLQRGALPPDCLRAQGWMDECSDMADTAALVAALDLVVCVDTAIAHLAGALGQKVWLLNRFDPCWRWMLGRTDSPWYPSLRQFRQPAPGEWDGAVADLAAALAAEVGSMGRQHAA